jgi:hypothetical protein
MLKRFSLALLIILNTTLHAQEETEKEPPPLDPKYMGTHNMVLVNSGSTIYATHLSTYNEPHNVQIVYRVDFEQNTIIPLVRDSDLVTIKSQPFNLQRLMREEEDVEITADIYLGHFDRGGFKAYEKAYINFNKPIYVRELVDLDPSSNRQKYDVVDIKSTERMLIHQIQSAPSYDHLMIQGSLVNCVRQFTTSSATPKEIELFGKLSLCGSLKPLYYEVKE